MATDATDATDATAEQEEKITLIMGQTNYTFEEASELLKIQNNDEFAIIRDYLGIAPPSSKNESGSKNQLIYKEIRNFMDGCKKI
jgi:hypothetical protein